MPEAIAIGCDVSKGRIDVTIRNQSGSRLTGSGAYDDTHAGHQFLRRVLDDLHERYPEAPILVGLEATGGMERNWLALFRGEKRWVKRVRVHHINVVSLARYRQMNLRCAPGDPAAADAIANYLLDQCIKRQPGKEIESGPIGFYRTIRALIVEQVRNRMRLQSLLVAAQPELVRFTHTGIPAWVYLVLERYPTAALLARASVQTLADLPHVSEERACQLIAAAKTSVASLTDPSTAATIRMLVSAVCSQGERIRAAQKEIQTIIAASDDGQIAQAVKLLESIPGVGTWTAICLACEIGDISRFAGPNALVAWAGLDPVIAASGDAIVNKGISHRGNANVRSVLFMVAMSITLHNPVLGDFYHRLVARGKSKRLALVALMGKLLRVAYAILVSGKPFDAEYAKKTAKPKAEELQLARATLAATESVGTAPTPPDLGAPVSQKETRLRRQAQKQQAAAGAPGLRDLSPKGVAGRPRRHAPAVAAAAKG